MWTRPSFLVVVVVVLAAVAVAVAVAADIFVVVFVAPIIRVAFFVTSVPLLWHVVSISSRLNLNFLSIE